MPVSIYFCFPPSFELALIYALMSPNAGLKVGGDQMEGRWVGTCPAIWSWRPTYRLGSRDFSSGLEMPPLASFPTRKLRMNAHQTRRNQANLLCMILLPGDFDPLQELQEGASTLLDLYLQGKKKKREKLNSTASLVLDHHFFAALLLVTHKVYSAPD